MQIQVDIAQNKTEIMRAEKAELWSEKALLQVLLAMALRVYRSGDKDLCEIICAFISKYSTMHVDASLDAADALGIAKVRLGYRCQICLSLLLTGIM